MYEPEIIKYIHKIKGQLKILIGGILFILILIGNSKFSSIDNLLWGIIHVSFLMMIGYFIIGPGISEIINKKIESIEPTKKKIYDFTRRKR